MLANMEIQILAFWLIWKFRRGGKSSLQLRPHGAQYLPGLVGPDVLSTVQIEIDALGLNCGCALSHAIVNSLGFHVQIEKTLR